MLFNLFFVTSFLKSFFFICFDYVQKLCQNTYTTEFFSLKTNYLVFLICYLCQACFKENDISKFLNFWKHNFPQVEKWRIRMLNHNNILCLLV